MQRFPKLILVHGTALGLALTVATGAWAHEGQDAPGVSGDYSGEEQQQGGQFSEEQEAGESQQVIIIEEEEQGQPGTVTPGTTETTEEEATRGYLDREIIGVRPQVGAVFFQDAITNDTQGRAAGGLILSMDATDIVANATGQEEGAWRNLYIGPETGVVYSHLGAPGSNFFGTDANQAGFQGAAGSNFLLIPANLKVGYTVNDMVRFAVHGGGNLTYRSQVSSMNLSDNDTAGAAAAAGASDWTIYPNVGASLDIGPFTFRPDITLTPQDEIVTTTLGVVIPIG